FAAEKKGSRDESGELQEVIHVSANPKYGSEKKGAPTAYFLVAAPERVRVNCDLRHVDVVLCCDPKAFTHDNPLKGIVDGGAFVWESEETPEKAWQQIPPHLRQSIIDKKLRLFILPGFDIAKKATPRPELQLRMQGNAFLGAFFKVSSLLEKFEVGDERFRKIVHAQYVKKFGRFGDAVVESNMEVMIQGGERIQEVPYGPVDAPDLSAMRGEVLMPLSGCETGCRSGSCPPPEGQPERPSMYKLKTFDDEFRAGLGDNQPASPLAAVG
ncbi:uncharacterized protein METZ01_LOCUS425221, partial [marine metagenome]